MYFVRKIEEDGRIEIPEDIRKEMRWDINDEITISGDFFDIILTKPTKGCMACNSGVNIVRIGRIFLCRSCIDRLNNAKDGEYLYVSKID